MTLIELLEITDENTNVNIYNLEGDLISYYDGKNSINEKLNKIPIFQISISNNILNITISV